MMEEQCVTQSKSGHALPKQIAIPKACVIMFIACVCKGGVGWAGAFGGGGGRGGATPVLPHPTPTPHPPP